MKKENKTKKLSPTQKIVSVAIFLIVWQIIALTVHKSILLVGPATVIKRLTTIWMEVGFFNSVFFTLLHILAGFFLGAVTGMFTGIFAHYNNWFKALMWPIMSLIRAVPVASFVVICLIWLSAKNLSILVSFLIVMPFFYQNIQTGLENVSAELLEMSRVFNLSFAKRTMRIIFPQIIPYIYSCLKTTIGMAWKAGVAAEIIGTPQGSIGKMLYLSRIYLDTDDLLAWTIIIVLLSILTEYIIIILFRFITKRIWGLELSK